MKRHPYLYATVSGASLFAWQLLTVAIPRLERLSPKTEALAIHAFEITGRTPSALIWIGSYLLLGLLCHLVPLWLGTRVFLDLQRAGPELLRSRLQRSGCHTLAMVAIVLTMVVWSRLMFPASLSFPVSDLLVGQTASPLLVYGTPAALAAFALIWLFRAASKVAVISSLAVSLALAGLVYIERSAALPARTMAGEPDLIVIGVDSLRPDHLKAFGFPGGSIAPNIDRLLGQSVVFDQAYTPQARTFVAYMGIFTGRYPTRTGARENLYPREMFERKPTLAHRLQGDGYITMLAIDEARFANFDSSFGFDHLAMPEVGALDFMVGSIYDTVGTNLFQLMPFSYKLMPHVAGNRGASATYRTDVFSRHIRTELRAVDTRRPLLGYFHFCAAHVPFIYDGKKEPTLPAPYADSPTTYRRAIRKADGQVGRLLDDLRQAGRLDNAIVVLLSDHGEALGMEKDRLTIRDSKASLRMPRIHGHGTYAADESQSRVLLAFTRYNLGQPIWSGNRVPGTVSLVDIAPTLLTLAGDRPSEGEFDGVALLDTKGSPHAPPGRPVFIESGISGTSLQSAKIDDQQVANEFSFLYRVTDDLRYELDPYELDGQLRQKQRGVVLGDTMLSSLPADNPKATDCWQIVNLAKKTSRCEPLDTTDPKVAALRRLACDHYRGDSAFSKWCRRTGVGPSWMGSASQ